MISTMGIMHAMPKMKRAVRNVKGGAYSMPIFDARKPEPQMATKYHARNESNQRRRETAAGMRAASCRIMQTESRV